MNRVSNMVATVTRRGLLVGTAGVGAALALRSHASTVTVRPVPPWRTYPNPALLTFPVDLGSIPAQLLDASPLADYRDSHIPGARHVWWQDTMELNAHYYGTVLKPDDGDRDQTRRQQLLTRWQLREGSPVIVYDRDDEARAARVAWFLRFLGIETSVLDGGFAGWLAVDSAPRDVPEPEPSAPVAESRPQPGFYLDVSETAKEVGAAGTIVVDIRTEGERSHGAMAGRTAPGVVWLPRDTLLDETGLIVPAGELLAITSQADVGLAARLVLIGDTGLDTALPWLALSLAGAPLVAICDGGWQEWADMAELPAIPL